MKTELSDVTTLFVGNYTFRVLLEETKNWKQRKISKIGDCLVLPPDKLQIRILRKEDQIVFFNNAGKEFGLAVTNKEIQRYFLKVKGSPYTFKDRFSRLSFVPF